MNACAGPWGVRRPHWPVGHHTRCHPSRRSPLYRRAHALAIAALPIPSYLELTTACASGGSETAGVQREASLCACPSLCPCPRIVHGPPAALGIARHGASNRAGPSRPEPVPWPSGFRGRAPHGQQGRRRAWWRRWQLLFASVSLPGTARLLPPLAFAAATGPAAGPALAPRCHRLFCPACSKNDPAVLERRQRATEELDASVRRMVEHNPGRAPRWAPQRVMHMDRFCLQHGKRCVMWDDEGAGFYLVSSAARCCWCWCWGGGSARQR